MVLQDKFKYPEDIVIRAIEYPVLELLYESRIHKFVHRLMITAHMHVLHNCAPIWRIESVSSEFFVGIVEEYCPQRYPEFRRDFAALHLAWKGGDSFCLLACQGITHFCYASAFFDRQTASQFAGKYMILLGAPAGTRTQDH